MNHPKLKVGDVYYCKHSGSNIPFFGLIINIEGDKHNSYCLFDGSSTTNSSSGETWEWDCKEIRKEFKYFILRDGLKQIVLKMFYK